MSVKTAVKCSTRTPPGWIFKISLKSQNDKVYRFMRNGFATLKKI
ncbi:hypothetical protein H206_06304 [Candidatus Electrothrix aarhusensis]|uniref:Uncharacterized protein n=1 Tax=Candidatus Electrothrix aarhusensis TaxID=1859131 RepID=A0A444J2Z0_9BACT|nr:hypothetical protein H206_06304 [Candidatus Electrothrix aarhusensis]